MDSSKVINTPLSTSIKLDMDYDGENFDQKTYTGMIGSLLYLIATGPKDFHIFKICLEDISPKSYLEDFHIFKRSS